MDWAGWALFALIATTSLRRRTSSVVGSSCPATSATNASVSVSWPWPAAQVVSSVAVCGR